MPSQEKTIGIITLGCKVNQYESEAIAEAFEKRGHRVLSDASCCDAYVINSCTVTAESDRKVRQAVRRAIHRNPQAWILVTGCLGQTDPDQLAAIEGVDFVCGNAEKLAVVDAAEEMFHRGTKNEKATVIKTPADAKGFESMRISRFDRTRAYIKIQDGCENHCAYCIIPAARGGVRSKNPTEVVSEVCALTEGGCREVVLTGIETASYGRDFPDCDLAELLIRVDQISGIGRVRLGSLDPSCIKQAFVDRIAPLSSVTPHFHLSMQSGSDRVLARMRRKYNTKMALEAMERLRAVMPDVQFTTDMIAGFPGETDEEFAETMEFIRKAKFLMIHAFPYSRRSGTEADAMPNQVPEQIKKNRVKQITDLQIEIRREILKQQIGRVLPVLIETISDGVAFGHTPNFIEVSFPLENACHAEICNVQILDADDDKCIGKIVAIEKPL